MFATKFDLFLGILFLTILAGGIWYFGAVAVWVFVVVWLRDYLGGRVF